jgi:ABC-type microcin C transport system permease subunit YejB
MTITLIFALCIVSAVFGRLVLTRDQAWKTIKVRLPALGLLILAIAVFGFFFVIFALVCFIGGSFYGLYTWWMPLFGKSFEDNEYLVSPIITGKW